MDRTSDKSGRFSRIRSTRAFGAALVASAAALAIGIPAQGQDRPESLLPPGFGDAPASAPAPSTPPPSSTPIDNGAPVIALQPPPPDIADNATEAFGNDALGNSAVQQVYELPDYARRSLAQVGAMDVSNGGFGADAYGNSSGALIDGLMRRLDAPIASRWLSIQLRRALLSNVPAPRGVAPADWVAERAWLLLRMGEADAARLLVQGVDVDRYSPKMYAVAVQSALATSDPAGFCPIADAVESIDGQPAWPLARAICAGLSGEAATSSAIIDRTRLNNSRDIDMLLAQKVAGAGSNGRRAINIEWDSVDALTPWRFGLANAVAVQVPDRLYATVGPEYQAWLARTPMVPPEQRMNAARIAAALGVFSNASLVDLYSQVADKTDPYAIDQSPAGYLRAAYVADDQGGRMSAMRTLWKDPKSPRDLYGSMILTARAAARIAPSEDRAGDAAALIASMMSAGLDLPAARWAALVARMDEAKADPAWSLLAVGAPGRVVDTGYARIAAYAKRAGDDGALRSRMLFAALAGLGRISGPDAERLAQELGVPVGQQNSWTRLLDKAVAQRQPGTVVLLAAIGMQTTDWRGVPPAFLFHIISALRQTGQGAVARMIAAEAVTRL
ncbi:hypothetical protein [Flavisphingomonas formosensis]|uniref:hypothetical protein n=1 Tax=Flavisphingomonas formosensis TaxID=861534 RepID=UPI001E5F9B44|nr:hypothetical protein [Sphingomonas formosensis]